MFKLKVKLEKFPLDKAAQKRMWTDSDCQFQASFCEPTMPLGIKGCPLGRSFLNFAKAEDDLLRRVKADNPGIKIEIGERVYG